MFQKSLVAAAGLVTLGAVPASAGFTNPYGCSAGVCTAAWDSGTVGTDWDGLLTTFAFPLFDSTLGTLNSVTVTATGQAALTNLILTNNSPTTSSNFHFTQDTAFNFDSATDGDPLDLALQNLASTSILSPQIDPTYQTATFKLTGNQVDDIGSVSTSIASNTIHGPVSSFEVGGGGTENVTVLTNTSDTFHGGGGNLKDTVTTTADLVVNITYDYTPAPIPEPISAGLLATGLVGFSFVRRRRSR